MTTTSVYYQVVGDVAKVTLPADINENPYYLVDGVTIDLSYDNKYVTSIDPTSFSGTDFIVRGTLTFYCSLVTNIGQDAFNGCDELIGLLNLAVMPGVVTINRRTFKNCIGFTSVFLPPVLTSIGDSAFEGCSGFTAISFPDNTSLKSIGDSAFEGCSKLTYFSLPDGVTSIGDSAFEGCTGFISISFWDTVTSIGDSAFYNCTGFTSLSLPNTLKSIGNSVFYNCSGFNSLSLPNTLTNIGNSAFENCRFTNTLNLYTTVITSLGDSAFYNCNKCTSLTLPSVLTSIGKTTFYGCNSFSGDLDLYESTPLLKTIGESAFETTTFYSVLTLPTSLTTINTNAFNSCLFTDLLVPNTVITLSTNVFLYTPIENIYFLYTGTTNDYYSRWNLSTIKNVYAYLSQKTYIESTFLFLNYYYFEQLRSTDYAYGSNFTVQWYTPIKMNFEYVLGFDESSPDTTIIYQTPTNTFSSSISSTMAFNSVELYLYPYTGEDFLSQFILNKPTTAPPTTSTPTTQAPTTQAPTTQAPTTQAPTTQAHTTQAQTTVPQTTVPTTQAPIVPSGNTGDICFVKDTLVETDQGNIPIQHLIPGKHTFFKEYIIAVTETIHTDSHLVKVSAYAFGSHPTKDTFVSKNHKINGIFSFEEAQDYLNGTTVRLVPYHGEPLYNVLCERHTYMKVHGMMVETLDPGSKIALQHKSKRYPDRYNFMKRK